MSRSGNHAILHWIFQQAQGRACFLNCVEPKTNPFVTARPMHDERRCSVNYQPFDLEREAAGELSPKDLLIYSYEDCFLSMICHPDFESRHDEFVGPSKRRVDVLILRDPFNLFASRWRSTYSGVKPRTSIRIWTQHARQFLGERNHVTQEFLPISYNRWIGDPDYRRSLADWLQIPFTDAGFDTVPATGGGSSFDERRFDGEATRMDVLRRWRHSQHDERYRHLFNAEVLRLADEIFGPIDDSPEFEAFVESLA